MISLQAFFHRFQSYLRNNWKMYVFLRLSWCGVRLFPKISLGLSSHANSESCTSTVLTLAKSIVSLGGKESVILKKKNTQNSTITKLGFSLILSFRFRICCTLCLVWLILWKSTQKDWSSWAHKKTYDDLP